MAVKVKEHFDDRIVKLEQRLARSAMKKKQQMASKTPISVSSRSVSSTGSRKKRASGKRKRDSTGTKASPYYQNVHTPSVASNAEMDRLKEQMRQMQAMIDSLAQSNAVSATSSAKKGREEVEKVLDLYRLRRNVCCLNRLTSFRPRSLHVS